MSHIIIPTAFLAMLLIASLLGKYFKRTRERDQEQADKEFQDIKDKIDHAESWMHMNMIDVYISRFDKKYSWMEGCADKVSELTLARNGRLFIIHRIEEKRRHPLKAI